MLLVFFFFQHESYYSYFSTCQSKSLVLFMHRSVQATHLRRYVNKRVLQFRFLMDLGCIVRFAEDIMLNFPSIDTYTQSVHRLQFPMHNHETCK